MQDATRSFLQESASCSAADSPAVLAEGQKAEAAYAKDKSLPDPESTDNPEFKIVLSIIKAGLESNPSKWTNMAKDLKGKVCAFGMLTAGQISFLSNIKMQVEGQSVTCYLGWAVQVACMLLTQSCMHAVNTCYLAATAAFAVALSVPCTP